MAFKQKPTYTLADFKGDFVLGQKDADVRKMQEILQYFGEKYEYTIDPQELAEGIFGPSTQEASEKLRKAAILHATDFAKDDAGKQLLKLVLQLVFRIDIDELDPTYARGNHKRISTYREATGIQFDALRAGVRESEPTNSYAANLALQYVGQREQGNNRGPMVSMFCNGQQGLPWCGGFIDYVMANAYGREPKVYGQSNPLAAISYETEAKKHGAFHSRASHYTPKAGDVVVFSRQGGNHVGIITGVDESGTVSYVAGNSSNAVRESTYSLAKPPASLRGYAATEELAAAKGISTRMLPLRWRNPFFFIEAPN